MDRVIKKKKWSIKKIVIIIVPVLLVIFISYSFIRSNNESKLSVEKEKITISTIEYGDFQEYIAVMGNIIPAEIEFLEAIQPGTVSKIYKKSGDFVQQGDIILELSNPSLQLNVMTQESSLYYQLSTIRSSKLQLNQNNLNQLTQLANINYQLNLLEPQYQRYQTLLEKKLISQWEFDQVKEQYLVNKRQKDLFLSNYKTDSIARASQLEQIDLSEERMIESLQGVRDLLKNLVIRSTISGQLSAPKFKVGQTINQGTRIGQISVLNKFEINAAIDETYLNRVKVGQEGSFDLDGQNYKVIVSKVYPTVTNATFQIDLKFKDETPLSVTGGQNVYLRIELSNPYKTTLLPVGAFYNKTGGSWIYVVDETGHSAVKRNIKVGNKNPKYFEVIEGLKAGEKVITSSYDLYKDFDVLTFD